MLLRWAQDHCSSGDSSAASSSASLWSSAAHLFASQWEFKLIEPLNAPFDDEMGDIGQSFPDRLDTFTDLLGLGSMRTLYAQ